MRIILAGLISAVLISSSSAQNFNQVIAFGDSTLDSGYFRYRPNDNPAQRLRIQTALANGGAITPSGGLMNPQYLGAHFGLPANPVDAPGGGTNYAIYAARINDANLVGGTSPSFVQQVAQYLAANNGRANPNGLYIVSIGSNDITAFGNASAGTAFQQFINPRVVSLVDSVVSLRNAGAQYITVYNGRSNDQGRYLTQATWNSLHAAGVNFIPVDRVGLLTSVFANPARFGLTSVTSANPACLRAPSAPAASGYAIYCIPSTAPAGAGPTQTAYLRAPNASDVSLFQDDLHLTPNGEKILADYVYSLIVAPSQISYLTESSIQFNRGVGIGIMEQIDISRRSTPGFNVWFNGDLSSLRLNNSSPGFPSDPSTPIAGTLGVSYGFGGNALLGGAITYGELRPTFSNGGGFKQQEISGAVFGGLRFGQVWTNTITSFGYSNFDVNRLVALGPATDSNSGSTRGRTFSFTSLSGYDFVWNGVRHGPVAGVQIESVGINPFTETGSVTSLGFSNIGRTSVASALGYRATLDYGFWQPFAQVLWNHELQNTKNKMVTATLTSITAPSYSLPIVQFGRDWASASVGTTIDLKANWHGLVAFSAQLGQGGVANYGGRLGINYALP